MAEHFLPLLEKGEIDPRLSLLGWASVKLTYPMRTARGEPRPRPLNEFLGTLSMKRFQAIMRPVIRACAKHLDPSFTASNRVSSRKDERFWNNFSERIVVGRKSQGVVWNWEETEHCADESYRGSWKTHGLADFTSVEMEQVARGRKGYLFSVCGPTPQALDVAALFGWFCRLGEDVTVEDIHRRMDTMLQRGEQRG